MKPKFLEISFFTFILSITHPGIAQVQQAGQTLLIETSMGTMKCILYEQTPMHADNFIELSRKGVYNGVLFHRVIKDFMIQTGDPETRNAPPGDRLGSGDIGYTIPAEFHPDLYHKKGALAAARQGDHVNPYRESDGSQFYIVQGNVFTDEQLDQLESSGAHIKFTLEQRNVYRTLGGAPHLDYAYTVFGEIVEGFEVIDAIANLPTDNRDRPLEDVKVIKISLLK
jgi:peptidyl-prolyl cis-trans isomerase B (cyclophilin B)